MSDALRTLTLLFSIVG